MTCLVDKANRINVASDLPALLDAAYDAFEDVITAVRGHDPDYSQYLLFPLLRVVASAADARDFLARAPSLPPQRRSIVAAAQSVRRGETDEHVANEIVALSEQLAARLSDAAATATDPADQAACSGAAACAQDMYAHLMGRKP